MKSQCWPLETDQYLIYVVNWHFSSFKFLSFPVFYGPVSMSGLLKSANLLHKWGIGPFPMAITVSSKYDNSPFVIDIIKDQAICCYIF